MIQIQVFYRRKNALLLPKFSLFALQQTENEYLDHSWETIINSLYCYCCFYLFVDIVLIITKCFICLSIFYKKIFF